MGWIEFDDLVVHRGGREVLRGISASLEGHGVGLVGANGAGKSTLIGALLGVLKPTRGRITVVGLQLPGQAMTLRARAGVMAEQAGIFPGGSGVDAVAFAGALTGLTRREALRRAHRALDAMGFGDERYRDTDGYSTGMKQKCKLAMSLVHEPELLILDEPTVGLDPPARAQLLDIVADLIAGGTRVLLSTHIMQDAERVCDEMLVIDSGEVRFCGPTDELRGERVALDGLDTGPATTPFLARGPGLGAIADALAAADVAVRERGDDWLTFDVDDTGLRAFWRVAADAEAEVRHLDIERASLEEAVVRAMGPQQPNQEAAQ